MWNTPLAGSSGCPECGPSQLLVKKINPGQEEKVILLKFLTVKPSNIIKAYYIIADIKAEFMLGLDYD